MLPQNGVEPPDSDTGLDPASVSNATTPQSRHDYYTPGVGIDLNSTGEQPAEYDVDELSEGLADKAAAWVPEKFPRGVINKDRTELRLANIHGSAPTKDGSCVITLKGDKAGCWHDFSTAHGGGPLSTLKEVTGLEGIELLAEAARITGTAASKPNGRDKPRRTEEDRRREAEHILSRSGAATDTLVETYLQARGVDLPPGCIDLRFNPDLTDYDAKIGRPGMVAIIRDPETGEPTGGIHRTYLAEDGSAKAQMEKAKMMLSPSAGVVQLMPIREDGALGVGEGIESSLAGAKIFSLPVWAALSAGNLRNMKFPPDLKRLLILADRGEDGQAAATQLCQRAVAVGIDAWVVLPNGDDDFADDLSRLECRGEDYQWFRPPGVQLRLVEPSLPQPPATYQAPPIELLHFRDMQPRIEDRSIVYGLLNQREISMGLGASGAGKTFWAIDLGLHVAGGRDWFGRPTRQGGLVYIAAEAGRGIENRVVAYKLHYENIPNDLPFAAMVSPVNLRVPNTAADVHAVLDAINAAAAEFGVPVALVIVDTLSRAMAGGDENSSEDMRHFVMNIDRLRAATDAHIMIVHHLGKDASRGARGHSLLHAAVDTEIEISRNETTGISTATVTKQRELPTAGQINYRLRSVELGCDLNGRPVTSCVVEPAEETHQASGKKTKLSAGQKRGLALLVDAVARQGQIPPANDHIPANRHACSKAIGASAATPARSAIARSRTRNRRRSSGWRKPSLLPAVSANGSLGCGSCEAGQTGQKPTLSGLSGSASRGPDPDGHGHHPIGVSCLSGVRRTHAAKLEAGRIKPSAPSSAAP